MDKNIVITIARQYGSGGRTIAQMLSEKLGIHYYDKEYLQLASWNPIPPLNGIQYFTGDSYS